MKDLTNRLHIATFAKDAVALIKENKLGIEINDTCISEGLDKENFTDTRKNIRNEILESDAKSVIFHGPFTEIHPAAIDHRIVTAGRLRLEEAVDLMNSVGGKELVVHTGYVPFIYFPSWQVEKSIKFWKEFMAERPKDFHLYIENVLEDEPYMLKEIVEGIGDARVKVCLDVGHANAMTTDLDIYQWVRILGKDIGHFHIHNNDGTCDAHHSLGEGSIDFEKLIAVIEENCNEEVTFTIESRDAASSIKWLKDKGYIK